MGTYPTMIETLAGTAELFASQGYFDHAVELFALVLKHPACHADTKTSAASLLSQLNTNSRLRFTRRSNAERQMI